MEKLDIRYQKGVGPKMAGFLSKLGIFTVNDLLYYFPYEYEDRQHPLRIAELIEGAPSLIKCRIMALSSSRTKRNFTIIKAKVEDGSGSVNAIWFNQPFLLRTLKMGAELFISGRFEKDDYYGSKVFTVRDYEIIREGVAPELILPRYALTHGVGQKYLRKLIASALKERIGSVADPVPTQIKQKYRLPELQTSIVHMHFPKDLEQVQLCKRRLAFDELFKFQLGLLHNRKISEKLTGIPFKTKGELIDKFKSKIPFMLTSAQERVLGEIMGDMSSRRVMNRLIQGDVGSGKTIIALYSMVLAVQSGYQAAIMAPTEILAGQHYKKIRSLVDDIGIKVEILTGSPRSGKKEVYATIQKGEPCIIIGTHALIESKVNFGRLGLVVIDEQHRFGVEQRLKLREKGKSIDLIVMTATPIPRTLALTLYGDLDRSVIDEMPPNRTKIVTRYIRENERIKLNEFIRAEINMGRQAYVVCPLVMESEVSDLKAAKQEAEALKKVFPEFKIGLIHGKMKSDEKDRAMVGFTDGKIHILVSTTVIEVGIDIPNSTIMVIEHAERFGLSQLHQLRGRIGRGEQRSYCFLAADPGTEAAKGRIDAMLKTDDGFKIAEADLKLRGPGEFFGLAQSGLPNFRVADIINDEAMIRDARDAAVSVIESGISLDGFSIKDTGSRLE